MKLLPILLFVSVLFAEDTFVLGSQFIICDTLLDSGMAYANIPQKTLDWRQEALDWVDSAINPPAFPGILGEDISYYPVIHDTIYINSCSKYDSAMSCFEFKREQLYYQYDSLHVELLKVYKLDRLLMVSVLAYLVLICLVITGMIKLGILIFNNKQGVKR